MPIHIKRLPTPLLDPKNGTFSGAKPKRPNISIGKMSIDELHAQAISMAQKGIPLKQTLKAIDKHKDIEDKETAKRIVDAVYKILGKS